MVKEVAIVVATNVHDVGWKATRSAWLHPSFGGEDDVPHLCSLLKPSALPDRRHQPLIIGSAVAPALRCHAAAGKSKAPAADASAGDGGKGAARKRQRTTGESGGSGGGFAEGGGAEQHWAARGERMRQCRLATQSSRRSERRREWRGQRRPGGGVGRRGVRIEEARGRVECGSGRRSRGAR